MTLSLLSKFILLSKWNAKISVKNHNSLNLCTRLHYASSTDSGSKLISFPGAYKIDIQQGNIITPEMLTQLRTGLTKEQVQYVMGSPLLPDTFNKNRWDYVYSLQKGGGKRTQEVVTLIFEQGHLRSIQGALPDAMAANMAELRLTEQ